MGQTKQYKQFQVVDPDGFLWKGEHLAFDSIRHLFFKWIKTIQRQNFVKVGEPEEAHILITLVDARTIHLSFDEQTILFGFNTDKKRDIDNLKQLYVYLLEKSFEHRLAFYLRELHEKGYFEYDDCRFYPKERIIFFGNIAFPLATSHFLKGNGYVELKKREMTFTDKVKSGLGLAPQFNTQTDPDVIFVLLDRLFGLRWKA